MRFRTQLDYFAGSGLSRDYPEASGPLCLDMQRVTRVLATGFTVAIMSANI
jgi:hypothetical protein